MFTKYFATREVTSARFSSERIIDESQRSATTFFLDLEFLLTSTRESSQGGPQPQSRARVILAQHRDEPPVPLLHHSILPVGMKNAINSVLFVKFKIDERDVCDYTPPSMIVLIPRQSNALIFIKEDT